MNRSEPALMIFGRFYLNYRSTNVDQNFQNIWIFSIFLIVQIKKNCEILALKVF